jgi:HSP20 family molecular chaperone IbpA
VLALYAMHRREGEDHCCCERGAGSLALPSGADADTVEASFENGALEVRPPSADKAKEKRLR